jgi:hypothetical protein
MSQDDLSKSSEIIKILTEDIQSHRDYIHRLYRSAFTVGAVLVSIGVGLGYWILGKQLDAKVFEYRIVESLRQRADVISKEIVDGAKIGAQNQVSLFVKEKIENEAATILNSELQKLSTKSLSELYAGVVFPTGAVVSFNRASGCSDGWNEFKPAYGRFIRGIDKTGSIDPDGLRSPSSIQDDMIKTHSHQANMEVGAEPPGGGAQASEAAGAHGRTGTMYKSNGLLQPTGGVETRPKNIALLYCEKA